MPKAIRLRARSGSTRKAKKTFTLSQESIALLEHLRHTHKGVAARSTSAILDEILRTFDAERKRQSVERAVAAYYDNLSDEEVKEDADWGEFALAQIVSKEK